MTELPPPQAAPPSPAPPGTPSPPGTVARRVMVLIRLIAVLTTAFAVWLIVDGMWIDPAAPLASDTVALGTFLLLVLFVAAALLGPRMRAGEVLRALIGWAVIILLVAGVYGYRSQLASVGGRLLAAFAPGVPIAGRLVGGSEATSVVVLRGRAGQFAVRARIDDVPLTMLIDTGASFVTLTLADAAGVGIDIQALAYTIPIRTANGLIRAAPITIDRLLVGTIERNHVPALVAPPDTLGESLLGMSFLETLGGYAISGDQLTLND